MKIPDMMRAAGFHSYGPPGKVLKVKEYPVPQPKPNQLLVKVHAASVNALDWHIIRASPFFVRFGFGLFRPKSPFAGADFSGVVVAVGDEENSKFKVGDAVFGCCPKVESGPLATYAEYYCVDEELAAHKAEDASFQEAACIGIAGSTALQAVQFCKISQGQDVLVNGASSGVGMFAVLIAKAYGANVTAVCSTSKMEAVRKMGADEVISYQEHDVTSMNKKYDSIVDAALYRPVSRYKKILKKQGRYSCCGGKISRVIGMNFQAPFINMTGSVKFGFIDAKFNGELLQELARLLADGSLKPYIDKTFPLEETGLAIELMEQRKVKGKFVIDIAKSAL